MPSDGDGAARPSDASSSSSTIAYTCTGVGKIYEGRRGEQSPVLHDVTFNVDAGQFTTIVGGSGTGKTTLLKILGGLIPSSSGSVRLAGEPVLAPPSSVVTVFQDYGRSLLPWRTVRANVALGLEGGRCPAPEREARVMDALTLVGLADSEAKFPWQLSGGMQQRVQIARALALQPKVLLMDEPFGALDAMTKSALQDELLRIHQEMSTTIVFITHDVEEAIYLGDQVVILSGRPATVSRTVTVGLPRPRDQIATRESAEFLRLRHELYAGMGVRT